MSSYRSYRPWNSSLPSYSSTSNYRSRYGTDSASSLSSSTSKYSSITPSSYRPSYSSTSGTYRASRAPAVSTTTSLTPTYTRTYSNLGKTSSNDEEKEKPKSYTRTYTSSLSKPKEEEEKEKARSYTRAYTSIGKTIENEKDRKEPSPPKRVSSRLSAKDLSAETKSRLSSAYSTTAKKEEKGPPITFNTRYKQVTSTRGRSRDPSPSANNDGTQTALQRISAARSRDPSPASSTISAYSRISSARSRDPSPVSKSYTDTAADKQQNLSRTFSNNLTVGNKSSDSLASKNLNRSLSSSLSAAREKLDKISSNLREKSRDPSPNRRPSITSITSSFPRSRDASPVSSDKYLLPSYRLTNGKEKSREPSPSIALNKPKLRESSPLNISNYRRPSREPSPAESLSKFSNSGFSNSSSYNKMFNKAPSPQVKSPEIALSYMTASESIAANAARSSRISFINRHSPQKEPSVEPVKPTPVNKITKIESDSESTETSSSDEESTDESSTESEEVKKPEPKIMIQVTTVTRATSPNPTSTLVSRTSRRIIEIAKTIEKVRERPLIAPPMIDKATQSDRMDDSTRYARYASTVRSPYSPFSPSPTSYSSRYTSGLTTTSRYSREPSELSNAETEKSESSQKSDKFNFALPKSKEGSPVKSPDTSRSSSNKSPSKICISKERNRTQSKSKTPILPQSPKAESPTKIASPNKDFRKSALNMGTAGDRQQRRSKSSSSENSSPTVEKTRQQFQNMLNGEQQQTQKRPSVERSPSLESDSSTESVEMASQIQPQHEMTKEEKITVKVEEAKNFLLKTLGNPAFLRKSPTPEESETACCDQSSSVVPETTENECSNISTTMNTTQVIEEQQPKQWWAIDDDTISNDNEVTITSNVGSTLQQDTNQIMNGFSEMTLNTNESDTTKRNWFKEFSLQRVDSGEKAWWCKSPENKMAPSENVAIAQINDNTNASNLWEQETQADISELQKDEEVDKNNYSLGDRASPEGLESHIDARKSLYDNINVNTQKATSNVHAYTMETDFNARPQLFISRHTNIDDLLGGSSVFSPTTLERPYLEMITPDKVRIHDSNSPPKIVYHKNKIAGENLSSDYQQVGALPQKLDDAAIQVYKDGDFGAYLDLESSLVEQSEEIEGLNSSRKNSLVVRTQLSCRIHAIIEKLLTSEGRELRRALFSLKQIFQEDKDLVHGFVGLGGLNCLVQIGNEADQNYQNYILRALGQVMLYVDGMNGVMKHGPTVQWLYTLIASKYRLVVKTALKLLLVFVEYCEGNCYLLVNAIRTVDNARGSLPWTNVMRLLKDYDNADTELLIYATSLINKTLSGLSDQDSFYDESDFLEQQGMESIIQRYMSRTGTDLDLLDQFQLYEAALRFEDGESDEIIRLPDNTVRKTLRLRSSDSTERRKSRRFSTGTAPPPIPPPIPTYSIVPPIVPPLPLSYMIQQQKQLQCADNDNDSSSSGGGGSLNGFADCKIREGVASVTPGLRRRRERAERQKSFQREQQEAVCKNGVESDEYGKHKHNIINNNNSINSRKESDHQLKSQYIINGNNRTSSMISNSNGSNDLNNHLILNNRDYNNGAIVTNNNKIYHHNHNNNIFNGSSNGVSKSVILNYDKNTLEYKNNKNLILNQHQNKQVDHNGNNHQLYEKHLNGINQLKNELQSTKRFIISTTTTSTPVNASNGESNKFNNKCINNHRDETDNANNNNGTFQLENIPTNVNIHKVNGHLNDFLKNGGSQPQSMKVTTDISNGYQQQQQRNGFIRNCSNAQNGRSNDFSTIKIISRHIVPQTVNNNHFQHHSISTNTVAAVNSMHDISPASTNIPSIPNIVINGNDDCGDKICDDENNNGNIHKNHNTTYETDNEDKKLLQQLKREQTVKDLTQKLSNLPLSPQAIEENKPNRVGDMSGLISKAKEELNKSKNKVDVKTNVENDLKKPEPKKSEIELHWEELMKNLDRDLVLCDLDFRDLTEDDEQSVTTPRGINGSSIPPPPPAMQLNNPGPPSLNPPPMQRISNGLVNGNGNSIKENDLNGLTLKKTKKTVKLFWKEVREDMIPPTIERTIWDELPPSNVDTMKLEHLFESRAKDLLTKKQQELNKNKEIIVLDHKRSNAINIAMTKLPPPRAIKAAILKMDSTVVTREGIEKLLNMLPTEEERGKIQEAQMLTPELPLGSAEQFLLTLASISELAARLKLWAFKLDFENIEKEIAEPLMDLKQGIELLKSNLTFKCILSTLLSIGCFLNGQPVKGFQIEYLAKVPEVKDTVHKHSLLHHLCHMVMESQPNTTDLYSEIGPITRASKADFNELAHNIKYLETECKASWDRLKLISKHDTAPQLKQKLIDFLADCAERIIILDVVHRRVINRYQKFLLWLGVPQHRIAESRPNEFCRILSEFALEYRTTRERVHQQIEKKANHRERNKTRGKLIIDVPKFRNGNSNIGGTKEETSKDAELRQLLGTNNGPDTAEINDTTFTFRRRRPDAQRSPSVTAREESFTDADDEIFESLVKTVTKTATPRPVQRERSKRTRNADRKSLRRTLRNGLTEEEKHHIQHLIQGY